MIRLITLLSMYGQPVPIDLHNSPDYETSGSVDCIVNEYATALRDSVVMPRTALEQSGLLAANAVTLFQLARVTHQMASERSALLLHQDLDAFEESEVLAEPSARLAKAMRAGAGPKEDFPRNVPMQTFEAMAWEPARLKKQGLRISKMMGHGLLLEFETQTGLPYIIEGSDDLNDWEVIQTKFIGTGERMQWLDSGLPKTDSISNRKRFYRLSLPRKFP